MQAVHKAQRKGQKVAIKIIHVGVGGRRRYIRDARQAGAFITRE